MHCANCGSPITATDKFCPKCGAAAQTPGTVSGATPPAALSTGSRAGQPEEKGRRVAAFLIDIVPALLLGVLNLMPFVGRLFSSALIAAYWLLRDINGASPGKMLLGSLVVSADGSPATTGQKIGRNLTLAVPGLLTAIPFIGVSIAAPLGFIAFFGEIVMLLATGRRVGDILAGTTVVRR